MLLDPSGREFERHVRGALASLYDLPRLQTHPLATFAAMEVDGSEPTVGRALQRCLREAIDALRPQRDVTGERAGRIHRLLTLRYIDGLEAMQAWQRLGIGKSEYHREHGRAIGAVASVLRARWGMGGQPATGATRASPNSMAVMPRVPRPLTRLIGRQRELEDIRQLVRRQRLVTLTGSGGCGKTRLAVELGIELAGTAPGGVCFVDLAALSDATLLPQVVLASLGGREVPPEPILSTLMRNLGPHSPLLVLDNCEHLIEACANLAELLLQACPELHVLATSREPLGVGGEVTWRVPSLASPDPAREWTSIEAVAEYDAVNLFIDRARLVQPEFALTTATLQAVAEVCARLDGIPLAIELAASRLRLLSVDDLLERLDDRFRLLTAGNRTAPLRHQTLRAAIDWSYQLLTYPEKRLFGRLSMFAGEFTLDAAEDVGSGDDVASADVLELLAHLADKSLVAAEIQDGRVRYRLLETLRQYALERLHASGEYELLRDRHLAFFVRMAEATNAHLGFFLPDAERAACIGRIESDEDNLRAALEWSELQPTGVEGGLRLAEALHWFWFVRGRFTEARGRLERLLQLRGAAPAVRARALLTAGFLAFWKGEFTAAPLLLEESRDIFLAVGEPERAAFAQCGVGAAASGRGEHELARSVLEAALTEARDIDDRWVTAFALHFLAQSATNTDDVVLASSLLEECIDLLEHLGGNKGGVAYSLCHLGRLAQRHGDAPMARSRFVDALRLFSEIGDVRGTAYALVGLAGAALAAGDFREAALLFGASDALRPVGGPFREVEALAEHDRDVTTARLVLGEDAFTALWTAGRSMPLDQTIAHALAPASSPRSARREFARAD